MTVADAPARARLLPLGRTVPRFLAVSAQLALILLVVYRFNLEPYPRPARPSPADADPGAFRLAIDPGRPFFAVMCLAAAGCLLHAWLPHRFRLAFFVLLSLASAVLLLGWTAAACVLGIGGLLLGLCLLPMPAAFRALLVAVAGLVLALWRVDSNAGFWPVLAALFMFRVIVYLYDTRRERRPPLLLSLAYFFPLPNLCFVLFPVLDFKSFRETYYDVEPYAIYQSGVAWIVRGLTHLLAYRYVKYYELPMPHEMGDLPHVLKFMAANYALYLRVSGWFHVVTGILHLFGFNLPRTHHNYFLAASVTDIWRRINIYWKEFMARVFFYPTFFTLRPWGPRAAVAAAGLCVFVATWLLHSYQLFWLRATLPLGGKDALLWLTAGAVVVLGLLLEFRRGREAPAPLPPRGAGLAREALAGARHGLAILRTFLLVSFFWACWSLPKFTAYLRIVAGSAAVTAQGALAILGVVAGVVAAGAVARVARLWLDRHRPTWREVPPPLTWAAPAAVLLVLAAAGLPTLSSTLRPSAREVLATLRYESTTPVEAAAAVQGYYDQVADTPLQVSPLLGGRPEPKHSDAEYTDFSREIGGLLGRELIPGRSGEVAGRRLTINGLGMRDRAGVAQEKPEGACRIAVMGSSVVMGWGVGDDEPFPRLLEERLNAREGAPGRVEVLNFGTGNSTALQRRALLDHKVFAFDPDAILFVAHQDEFLAAARHLSALVAARTPLPYPYLDEVVRAEGVTPDMTPGEVQVRLQLSGKQVLRGVYRDTVAECRRRGIVPVWVYVPMPGIVEVTIKSSELIELAEEAGFVVINLAAWAEDHDPDEVKIDRHHANALGHRLIAERLEAALRATPGALPKCARPH
jgi:hypothetical protein